MLGSLVGPKLKPLPRVLPFSSVRPTGGDLQIFARHVNGLLNFGLLFFHSAGRGG